MAQSPAQMLENEKDVLASLPAQAPIVTKYITDIVTNTLTDADDAGFVTNINNQVTAKLNAWFAAYTKAVTVELSEQDTDVELTSDLLA